MGAAVDGTPAVLIPAPRLLATCSADQTCKIWRTSNFSLMTELSIKSSNPGESSRGWMWGCAFSGDSQYIVTGGPRHHAPRPTGPARGCSPNPICALPPSLQLPLTTWPGSGVWRQARSRESMAATRKLLCAWPSTTVCWASLVPGHCRQPSRWHQPGVSVQLPRSA